jgi:hypothetical protein
MNIQTENVFKYLGRHGYLKSQDGSWRKFHNGELHSMFSSPKIVRVIKSRRMRWARHVVCMEERRGPKGRDHWEDLGVSGRITLRWTLGRQVSIGQTGFSWLRIESRGGLLLAR